MKFGFLAVAAVVLALVVAAVLLASAPRESPPPTQQPPQNNSPPTTQQTDTTPQQPVEVTWQGYIYATVGDIVDPTTGRMTGGYTEWFFGFGNGTTVRLDLTNATFRLRDHFIANYRDRLVYVRGIWNGTVLKALEIYDYVLSGYVVGYDVLFVNGSSVTYFFLMLDNGTMIPLVEPPPAYLIGERVEAEIVFTEEGVRARVLAPREPT
jgi:uncharacterized protein YcfJ